MAKASYGVNAKVAEPTNVRAKALPGSKTQGDSAPPKQGSSVDPDYDDDDTPKQYQTKTASGDGKIEQGSSRISQPPQVTAEDLDLSDDIAAIFEGVDLSEDFKNKATFVFETAVAAKANELIGQYADQIQEEFEAIQQDISEDLTLKLDQYLDYVIEQWMEENELAVESGIKSELAENVLVGLRDLMVENYISVPEDADDLVNTLASRIEELEGELNHAIDENVELKSLVKDAERQAVFEEFTEGLTETQIAKLASLAESLDFETMDDFREKLETLRESYFPENISRATYDDEDPIDLNEETTPANMQGYVSAISRTAKKR